MKIKNWKKLVVAIVVVQVAGGIGAIATTSKIEGWYGQINKPWFNPPNWIFGPVWTVLFLLMGVALYLVWEKKAKRAMVIFWGQLLLNILWSFIFFGWEKPGLATVEIVILWAAIVATIVSFRKISKTAAGLLVPYLLWVSFAAVLNLSVYQLNK